MKHSKLILSATGLFLAIAGAFATKPSNHYGLRQVYTGTATPGDCRPQGAKVCNVLVVNNTCFTGLAKAKTVGCIQTLHTGGGTAF